jgi:hypothetical protein
MYCTIFFLRNQVNKNGDRFEGEFLDRLPHGKVIFVKNPSAQNDMTDDADQVGRTKKLDRFTNLTNNKYLN